MAVSRSTDRFNGYVASLAIKAPCVVATNAEITLEGIQTVNGVALTSGDRVLVKDQTVAKDNGIYVVRTTEWERAPDFDGNRDVTLDTCLLVGQSVGEPSMYRVNGVDPFEIGVDDITFTQFFDPGNPVANDLQAVTVEGNTTNQGIVFEGPVSGSVSFSHDNTYLQVSQTLTTGIALENDLGVYWDDESDVPVEMLVVVSALEDPDDDPDWSSVVLLLPVEEADGSTTTVDVSQSAHTPITFFNDADVSTDQSEFGTASLHLPGVTDGYVSVPHSADWDLGNGDFTIEFDIYYTGAVSTSSQCILSHWFEGAGSNRGWRIFTTSNNISFSWTTTGAIGSEIQFAETHLMIPGTWYRWSITRTLGGTKFLMHQNGQYRAQKNDSTTIFNPTTPLLIGRLGNNVHPISQSVYVDNVRITKGFGRYPLSSDYPQPSAEHPQASIKSRFYVGDPAYKTQIDGLKVIISGVLEADSSVPSVVLDAGVDLQMSSPNGLDSMVMSLDDIDANMTFSGTVTDLNVTLQNGIRLNDQSTWFTSGADAYLRGDVNLILGYSSSTAIQMDGSQGVRIYHLGVNTMRTASRATGGGLIYNDLTQRDTGALERILSQSDVEAGQFKLLYTFTTSITAADPGNGIFKFDASPMSGATNIYIDDLSYGNLDAARVLNQLLENDILRIASVQDETLYLIAEIGVPVDNTGWWTIPITVIASSGTNFSNHPCVIEWEPAVTKAATGLRIIGDINTATPPAAELITAKIDIYDNDETDQIGEIGFDGNNSLNIRNFMRGGGSGGTFRVELADAGGVLRRVFDSQGDGVTRIAAKDSISIGDTDTATDYAVFSNGGSGFLRNGQNKLRLNNTHLGGAKYHLNLYNDVSADTTENFMYWVWADNTPRGVIGHNASGWWIEKNEVHGGFSFMQGENAVGTTVTYIGGKPDNYTEIYHPISLAVIARSMAPTAGGFEVNNTLTGLGFERVLTTGDGDTYALTTGDTFTGTLKLNNATAITGRNAADSADVFLTYMSATDVTSYGQTGYKQEFIGTEHVFNGDVHTKTGFSTAGTVTDIGQVGQIAFMDISSGIGRVGSYNYDTVAWMPMQVHGLTVEILGDSGTTITGTSLDLEGGPINVLGQSLRVYDSTELKRAQFSHSALDFDLSFDATNTTTDFNIDSAQLLTGQVKVFTDTHFVSGAAVQIRSSDNTDTATFSHDLTDFNTVFVTTTDWNINDLTGHVVIEAGSTDGASLALGGYIQHPTFTDTQLNDITHAVNTATGKIQGAMVYNSTQNIPVYAVGNADGSLWVDGAGTTVNTPV